MLSCGGCWHQHSVVGSENSHPVAPLGSRPWRVRSGPEIHQKIGNFKTFNIYSFQTRSPHQGLEISPVSPNFLYFPVYITDMSIENCIMFNITTDHKEIFMGIGSIQEITFSQVLFFWKVNLVQTEKKVKKTKSIRDVQKWWSGEEWIGECRIQSQEGQELGSPAAATTHIAQTSGVTHSVDLTNKGMGNDYFRDVHDFRTALWARGPYLWHSSPTRHLKV